MSTGIQIRLIPGQATDLIVANTGRMDDVIALPLSILTVPIDMFRRRAGVPGQVPRRLRRSATCAWRCVQILLAAIALGAAAPALAATASEYQVKAVFLFNFAQFVSWPPTAFAGPAAPFVVGVLGRDPFGTDLDAAVRGERVDGRPMVVRRYRDVAAVKDCQILFIDRSEAAQLSGILTALRGRSILSVSDDIDAANRGVIIQFFMKNDRIRLRINLAAARTDGLTISSKLLQPAEIIDTAGK